MCTTTNTQEARTVKELLSLTTYQGMSDEEIDLIIDYKVKREVESQEFTMKMTNEMNAAKQMVADNKANADAMRDMVQSMLDTVPNPLPIGTPNRVTPVVIPSSMEM